MESRSRWISIVLGLVAASAFALSVQLAWWYVAEVTVGPFGSRHCFGGECRGTGLAWLNGSELWMRASVATRAAGYIAMFAFVFLAGAVAARRVPILVARAAIVAVLTAAACGIYFFVKFPGLPEASLGWGAWLFVTGIVAGIAASIVVLRSAR